MLRRPPGSTRADTRFPSTPRFRSRIGHLAMVHGCTLADRAFGGLKATVMNGCRIGSDAMLAAGALLTENKEIPDRELWAGSPARPLRAIGDAPAAGLQQGGAHYAMNGRLPQVAVGEKGISPPSLRHGGGAAPGAAGGGAATAPY